ncbi:MAG: nucleotidyltransferase family protein [Clostridia bacterium]|nr:nucleotidyltransferase family protein [Clostridia bacterium]
MNWEMMNSTQKYFLEALSDFISGRATAVPPDADPAELLRLADIHSVGGIIWAQCRELFSDPGRCDAETAGRMHSYFLGDVYVSLCRREATGEITDAFEAAGIGYMPFKGEIIKDLYPAPELREMGDIDILVSPSDMDAACEIMKGLGYTDHTETPDVTEFHRGLLVYEIHRRAIYEDIGNGTDAAGFFDAFPEHAVRHGLAAEPEAGFHYAFITAHTAKHIVNRGSGFRPFLDMILLARKVKSIPEEAEKTREMLNELKLSDFESICSALCLRWFGGSLVCEPAVLTEEFFEETTEKVFRDGVFGKSNGDTINEHGNVAKTMKRRGIYYVIDAVKFFFGRIFPPYGEMRYVESYSFIDGRPWLIPAAWVKRWVVSLFRHPGRSARLALHPMIRKNEIDKRNRFLRDWGIGK